MPKDEPRTGDWAFEQSYRQMFEANPLPMWIYDCETLRFLAVNAAAAARYGYTREEFLAMTILEIRPEEEVARLLESKELDARRVYNAGLWRHRAKDGSLMDVQVIVHQVDFNGRAGALVTAIDMTAQVELQAELREAKDAAESASRMKSDFLANMSHEIRTPMNGIMGMTELALETDLTAEQRDYLANVLSSAEHLLTVINDVLDFSKIEAGKMTLDPKPFDLAVCLEETLRAVALQAHQKGLELLCRIGASVPETIVGDAGRLRQILVNLIGNAIKFTEKGEVLVEAGVESRSESAVVLRFTVTDTGIGIEPGMQEAIFEAFTQVDGSRTRRYSGTGLGLAISQQLVCMMKGRIWVESEAHRGSSFTFTIEVEATADALPAPLSNEGLAGTRVLIVDDNAVNRRILEEMLARWGMIASSTSSANAALGLMLREQHERRPFPLVLVDAQMPGVDGFALARAIKSNANLADSAIMMLSSANLSDDAARCREVGVELYLVKPVMRAELRRAILQILQRSPGPALLRLASSIEAASGRGFRVLLVEDNPVNQKLAVRLLEKRGHSVIVADDGRRALEAYERGGFEIILMDIQMPEMSGFEVTEVIRERERLTGAHMPIIALTAHAMKGDRERCLAAGMDDYISKPIVPAEFFEKVDRLARTSTAAAPAVSPS